MNTALEQLSKQQLIALIEKGEKVVAARERAIEERDRVIREKEAYATQLLALIDKFKRMAFAQNRERFEGDSNQMMLPFESSQQQQQEQQEAFEQKIEYVRKKKPTAHKGRVALPDHLAVEEVEIYPEGDLSGMVCIGKEVTEELDYVWVRSRGFSASSQARESCAGVASLRLPQSRTRSNSSIFTRRASGVK